MRHANTRRALRVSACILWLAASGTADPLPAGKTLYGARSVGERSTPTLPAPANPARSTRQGLRLPAAVQFERKAGFQYRTELVLGDASWVLRFKGPLVKRKRLGLGIEFEF